MSSEDSGSLFDALFFTFSSGFLFAGFLSAMSEADTVGALLLLAASLLFAVIGYTEGKQAVRQNSLKQKSSGSREVLEVEVEG